MQKIRGLSQIAAQNNNQKIKFQLLNIKDGLIRSFSDPAWNLIRTKYAIETDILFIKTELKKITEKHVTQTDDIFDRYTFLIEKMHILMLIVANRSSLILDPELETYYLMEFVVKDIPYINEAVGRLRGMGSGAFANKKITLQDIEKIKIAHYVLKDHIKHFELTKTIIKQSSTSIYASSTSDITRHGSDMKIFSEALDTINKTGKTLITPEQFFQYGTNVISNYINLHKLNTKQLIQRLEKRATKIQVQIVITIIEVIIAVIAIFYFALRFYRQEWLSIQNLEHMSITDSLTSIPNRRYMDTVFHRELKRARREKRAFAFGILDIDYFKQYNDTYGHRKGDEALQQVAGALMESLQRGSDYYFRFGGEEFCFLIYPSSFDEAKNTTKSIFTAIANLDIEHKANLVAPILTISLGLVFIDKVKNENMDFILKQADDLMYKGKNQGRNQYICERIKK
ncbi:MAG: GGDEF domain-containing protein [Gammaproteobacteria bacterium]|nr:GGDEF domain-containing protein [Gammaproteobacteria bacterium]